MTTGYCNKHCRYRELQKWDWSYSSQLSLQINGLQRKEALGDIWGTISYPLG